MVRVVLLLCAAASLSSGATDVSGTLATTRWMEDASPYRVTGDLQVPLDATLTIDPGVAVTFAADVVFVVRGAIEIAGTAAKPVRFFAADAAAKWGGFVLQGAAARGRFVYLDFTGSTNARVGGTTYLGAFNVTGGAKARLEHCWVHDLDVPLIESNGGSELVILDSLVEHGREGIHSAKSYAHLERVKVHGMVGYSDCIDFDFASTPRSVIRDCLIDGNAEDDGIDLGSSDALVEKTVIRGIGAGKAISMDSADAPSTPLVREVLIYDCKYGLVIKDSCTPVIQQATVARCERGVDCYKKVTGDGGHGSGENLILWGNQTAVALDGVSTFPLTYSIAAGGYAGAGNLDVDPLFRAAAANDFHLAAGSPAIGTGNGGTDRGAYTGRPGTDGTFLRADANGDGRVDLSDPITILLVLFANRATPRCADALDANDDGDTNVADVVFALAYGFAGGPPPPPPFPDAGTDPTGEDPLGCGEFTYFR